MVNIGKITANIAQKWTKNGYRLLSKENIKFDSLPKNLIPKGTSSLEKVEIATNFGGGLSKVYSFRNNENKLLKKVIIKQQEGQKTSKIIRKYEYAKNVRFTDTKFLSDGKITKGTKEAFTPQVTGISRMKLQYKQNSDGSRFETQIYENLAPKWATVENNQLKTTAIRLKDGKLINKTIDGNPEIISKVKDDPYLYIRNYDNENFVLSAAKYAEQKQDVVGMSGKVRLQKLKKCCGYYQDLTNNVTIDPNWPKSDLVDTINHEFRHKWQHKIISNYKKSFFNFFRNNKIVLTDEEKILAPKLLKADVLYCPMQINYNKYYNNFLEKDARLAGDKAQKEFDKYSDKLAQALGIPTKMTFSHTSLNDVMASIIAKGIESKQVKVIKIDDLFKVAKDKS